jgi:hypothetical protein
MSEDSRRCMVLAEIGNGYRMEWHITEVGAGTTFDELIEWVKGRDDHLDDDLRGKWTRAEIYVVPVNATIDEKRHAISIRNRRGGISWSS